MVYLMVQLQTVHLLNLPWMCHWCADSCVFVKSVMFSMSSARSAADVGQTDPEPVFPSE